MLQKIIYNPDAVDKTMKCSSVLCKRDFVDVIKLMPECGLSICGRCYERIDEDIDSQSKQYKCKACGKIHLMPENGLPDNKGLLGILNEKNFEKPLSDQAKSLKAQVELIQSRLQDLNTFDGIEYINNNCSSLELEITVAAESARKHIDKMEESLLKKINDYCQECLDSLHNESSNQSLEALTSETDTFIHKWTSSFTRLDVLASEKEIDEAMSEANTLDSRIQSLETELRTSALQYKNKEVKINKAFFEDNDCLGGILSTSTKPDKDKSMVF